jgi:predicted nucleotidyltransferase
MFVEAKLGIREVIGDKREEILRLAAKHGASNVCVFGSVARGDATSRSDVDFLVDWDLSRISPWSGVGLNIELEELLGRKIDVTTDDSLHPAIRDRALHDAVTLRTET